MHKMKKNNGKSQNEIGIFSGCPSRWKGQRRKRTGQGGVLGGTREEAHFLVERSEALGERRSLAVARTESFPSAL
jgi:hypothetical protein